MLPRVDSLEAIGAQFRDLVAQKLQCSDQDSAEVLNILWRIDCLLDRYLGLVGRESNSGPPVHRPR